MERIGKILNDKKVAPYIFVLPFILTFLIFFIYPIIVTTIMSFQEVLPGQTEFIALANYKKLFSDKVFYRAVFNSVMYMFGTCLILIPIPMLFATIINSKFFVGKTFFKSSLYIPALTSVVVAGTIFRLSFSELDNSLANSIIGFFNYGPLKWLKEYKTGYFVLLTLACWRWTGVNMLYFLSGLQSIPQELYESSDIDGATPFQKFTKITLPLLKPTSVYVLTISVYAGLAMFTESYMVFGVNSPNNIGLTIVGYLYKTGFSQNRLGYASAIGLVLLAIAMIINLTQLKITGTLKKGDE